MFFKDRVADFKNSALQHGFLFQWQQRGEGRVVCVQARERNWETPWSEESFPVFNSVPVYDVNFEQPKMKQYSPTMIHRMLETLAAEFQGYDEQRSWWLGLALDPVGFLGLNSDIWKVFLFSFNCVARHY